MVRQVQGYLAYEEESQSEAESQDRPALHIFWVVSWSFRAVDQRFRLRRTHRSPYLGKPNPQGS